LDEGEWGERKVRRKKKEEREGQESKAKGELTTETQRHGGN